MVERDMDLALQRAMAVVEDVLQSAATSACMKAEEALRLRLQSRLEHRAITRLKALATARFSAGKW